MIPPNYIKRMHRTQNYLPMLTGKKQELSTTTKFHAIKTSTGWSRSNMFSID
jgi:hypothetical protein